MTAQRAKRAWSRFPDWRGPAVVGIDLRRYGLGLAGRERQAARS